MAAPTHPNEPPFPGPGSDKPEGVFFYLALDDAPELSEGTILRIGREHQNQVPCEDCGRRGVFRVNAEHDEARDEAMMLIGSNTEPGFAFICPDCLGSRALGDIEEFPCNL